MFAETINGNGNVMALVNAADGTVAANYDYGPFGEVIRSTGPMAKVKGSVLDIDIFLEGHKVWAWRAS